MSVHANLPIQEQKQEPQSQRLDTSDPEHQIIHHYSEKPNFLRKQTEERSCTIVTMAEVWFTSDFHLGHFNIIRYCNRPFIDTREMNATIVDRVNASVKPGDVLYFLGDFCMGGPKAVIFYRDQLACQTIHFIDGNHDRTARKVQHLFTSWSSLSEIRVGKQGIVLCHYAMKVWPHHSRGTWQLYGHSHGNLPDDPLSLSMDVGVDSHDFWPWHFDEIQAVMKVKAEARAKDTEMRESVAGREAS